MSKNLRGKGRGGFIRSTASTDDEGKGNRSRTNPSQRGARGGRFGSPGGGDGTPTSNGNGQNAFTQHSKRQGGYSSDASTNSSSTRGVGRGRGRGVRGRGGGGGGGTGAAARGGLQAGSTKVARGAQHNPEDKDGYKKRYDQVKAKRDKEREAGIKAGVIHDVERPHLFKHHLVSGGPGASCEDMCPEFERLQRIIQNDVVGPEYDQDLLQQGQKIPREDRMVKKFRRADAGAAAQGPEDLRTPATLRRTLDFLVNNVVGEASHIGNVAAFVWDRTRAIRNDFSIMNSRSLPDMRIQIECLERIVRYHLVSMHQCAVPGQTFGNYSHQQDYEQLTKAMMSLSDLYKLVGDRYHSPNEAEFRTYQIIFQMTDPIPDLENTLQTQHSWRTAIIGSRKIQRALDLYTAAQNMADARGPLQPRANHLVAQQSWQRFWRIVRSTETSYLMACAAEIFFNLIRRTVLHSIWASCRTGRDTVDTKMSDWTLDDLLEAFAFDEEEEVIEFCEFYGFNFGTNPEGIMYLDLSSVRGSQFPVSNGMPAQHRNVCIVESKLYNRNLAAVINGLSIAQAQQAGLIDDADEYGEEEEEEEEEEEGVSGTEESRSPYVANGTKSSSLFVTGDSDDEDDDVPPVSQTKPTPTIFNPQASLFKPSSTPAGPTLNPFAKSASVGSSDATPTGTQANPTVSFGAPSPFGAPSATPRSSTSAANPFVNPFQTTAFSTSGIAQKTPQAAPSFGLPSGSSTTSATSPINSNPSPFTNPFPPAPQPPTTSNVGFNLEQNNTLQKTNPSPFSNPFAPKEAPPSNTPSFPSTATGSTPFGQPQKILPEPTAESSIPSISIHPPSEADSDSTRSTPAPGPSSFGTFNPGNSAGSAVSSTSKQSFTPPTSITPTTDKAPTPKAAANPFGFAAAQYPAFNPVKSTTTISPPPSTQSQSTPALPTATPQGQKPLPGSSFFNLPKPQPTPTAKEQVSKSTPGLTQTETTPPQKPTYPNLVKDSPKPAAEIKGVSFTPPAKLLVGTDISSLPPKPAHTSPAAQQSPGTSRLPAQPAASPSIAPSASQRIQDKILRDKRRDELFGQIAEDLFHEPERGILQQFIEFEVQSAFAQAKDQLETEKLHAEADAFRSRKLAKKYCRHWFYIVKLLRARKHGKERRKRYAEAKAKASALRQSSVTTEPPREVGNTEQINVETAGPSRRAIEMPPPNLPRPERRRKRAKAQSVDNTQQVDHKEPPPNKSLFGHSIGKAALVNTTKTDYFRRSLQHPLGYDMWHNSRKRGRGLDEDSDEDWSTSSMADSNSPQGRKRINKMPSNVDLRTNYTRAVADLSGSPQPSVDTSDTQPIDPADAELFARVRRLRQSLLGVSIVSPSPRATPERSISHGQGLRRFSPTVLADPTLHTEQGREIAQALEESTSYYREEMRRVAQEQQKRRHTLSSSALAATTGKRVFSDSSQAESFSQSQWHQTSQGESSATSSKPAYWARTSKFLPKEMYGKSVLDPNRKPFSLSSYEAEELRKEKEKSERARKRAEEAEMRERLVKGGSSAADAIEL